MSTPNLTQQEPAPLHLTHTAEPGAASAGQVLTIRPPKGALDPNLRELWEYRELLFFLVWRDIKVKYKQTVLGIAWAVLQPFMTMVVFSIFFGGLARIPSEGLPYPVFAYCALVPWTYFSTSLSGSSSSLVASAQLLTKVYFPRLVIPLAAVLVPLPDLAIAFSLLVIMLFVFGIIPTAAILVLPLFIVLAAATALGVGLWLSALNVRYRDFNYTVPFLIQVWLFASPIAYPSSLVPEQWRALYGLNPMVGVVEGFRWALLGQQALSMPAVAASMLSVLVVLASGLVFFRRMEQTFGDEV